MGTYRNDFREAQREYYWTLPRVLVGIAIAAIAIGAVGWTISLLSQPARVITKTFDADNIINNYEFFHDANNNIQARTAQIRAHRKIAEANADPSEANRLRIEVGAMQQSCRDLVARYNSNATKVNRSIFMGRSAPESINPSTCE